MMQGSVRRRSPLLLLVVALAVFSVSVGIPPAQAQQSPAQVYIGETLEGDTALTVAWPPPAGGPITGYDVEYKESAGTNWTDAGHTGAARFLVITGLTNGTTYDVRARAKTDGNIVGEWSRTVQGTPRARDLPPQERDAQAGGTAAFDSTFGGGAGYVVTNFGSGNDEALAVAVLRDGKIVAAGYGHNGSDSDFALVRYTVDGTLDATFGNGGKVLTDFGSGNDSALGVAVLRDGKIVAAGYGHNGSDSDFALVRYTADGSLDATFGNGGKVLTDFGSGNDSALGVAVLRDGKIVAAGYGHNGSDTDFALVRYTVDGTLDATFGNGGKVLTDFGSGSDSANAVVVHFQGKIVVAGTAGDSPYLDIALARYNADGTPDTGFGDGGKVTTNFTGTWADRANAVTAVPGGMIAVAGLSNARGPSVDVALARYNHYGALDMEFGDGGKVLTDFRSDTDEALAMALQADGKIVVAGGSENGDITTRDFALARYDEYGRLDTAFGDGGRVITPIGSDRNEAFAIALQPDGRIVTAGLSDNGSDTDFAVARYVAEPRKAWINSVEPGNASLTVTWGRPLGEITGYDVEYRESTADAWTDAGHTGEARTITIGSLNGDTTYDVRVRAKNGIGAGWWSNVREGTTPPPCASCGTGGEEGAVRQSEMPTAVTLTLGEATVSEGGGQVNITTTLDAPAPPGGFSLALFPGTDSTAAQGADYSLPDSIAVPEGERSGEGVITVVDDALDEDDETVVLAVFAVVGSAVLADQATLTIRDDDTAGVTVRTAGPLEVDEGGSASYTAEKYAGLISKMKE